MREIVDLALAAACALAASAPALADSKAAAEFALKTCLAAVEDPTKVEAMAREHNWTTKSLPNATSLMSQSVWEVVQGEDRFHVTIGTMLFEKTPPLNFCSVFFLSRNVNRDEFFNLISASAESTFLRDNTRPRSRVETYEIKSDGTNKLILTIMSQTDGTLMGTMMQELPRLAPRPTAPAAPGES